MRLIFFGLIASLPLLADFESFVQQAVADWKVPGAAVVVVEGDRVVFAKGFGVLEAGGTEAVDADTLFQLASVAKTFTAAALSAQMIDWDQPVRERLPQLEFKDPYVTRFATARDLLAHRTGLPSFRGDLLGKLGYDNAEILRRVRFIEPATSFRERPHYSNIGYFIAGELLPKDAVEKTLLEPLEMTRSGFSSVLDGTNVARPHAFIDGKLTVIDWDRAGGFPAAGGLCSTANDMAKWMKMLLQKPEMKALFASSMAGEIDFSEAPPIDEYSGFDYGMGWANYHYKGSMIVEKGGGLDGIRTVVTLIPEKKLGITVLSNLNLTLFPEAVRAAFLEEYVGKSDVDLQKLIREKQVVLDGLLKPPEKPKNVLPARALELYAGSYHNDLYGTFKVEGLAVEAGPAAFKGRLTHFSGDTFILTWPVINSGSEEVTFIFGPDGKAKELQTETLGTFLK